MMKLNSKAVKAVSGFLGLATAVMMIAPAIASADTTSCSYVFTKALKKGVTDTEVMNLQKVLNMSADTQVAATGVGSMGNETSYFGGLTKMAVVKFQNKFASDILTPNGLTAGTGLVGVSTRAKLNAMCGGTTSTTGTTSTVPGCTSTVGFSPTTGQPCSASTTTTTTTGTGTVSVMLDPASPASGVIIAGQSVATLAIFKVSNTGSTPSKVTMLKLKRTGVSADTTMSNVYLYNGSSRITDAATVAQGVVSFNDASGIVTVPAMSSVMLAVRSDIAAGTNGQTLGVMLTDVSADGVALTGLPISGAQMSIAATPSGMTTVDFNTTTSPTAAASIDPQHDFTMWQNAVTIGSRDALLSAMRFRQIGSAQAGDLANFRLFVDGVMVGSAVASTDARGYVNFAFPTPLTLKAGNRTIKLVGDIVGGSNRTFQFSLQQAADAEIWDSQLNVPVLATANSSTFSARTIGLQTVNQGTLTITRTTDSPSGNVVLNGSSVSLGKFTFRAAGENMRVENLNIGFSHNGSTTLASQIRNGAIFANGVQVGSTQNILNSGTQFNLGSALVVMPGSDVTVEIRGDVYNPVSAGGAFVANNTITANILAPASANVYRMMSYGYVSNGTASGNQLTVASGALTLAKYSAYANQTVTVPQTAYKLGDFRLTSASSEGVNLDTITVVLSGTVTDITNLYVVYGTKTTSVKATGAASQSWSINEPFAANSTMSVAVYGTLASTASGIYSASTTVSGTSQVSGNAVSSASNVAGQLNTVANGSLTTAVDASTPVNANVVGLTMPKVASFKYTSLYDTFTLKDIGVTVGGVDNASAISNMVFKVGATEVGRTAMNGTAATGTGLNVTVPANGSVVVDVYTDLGPIGVGAATTSQNVAVTLSSTKYMNSNGVVSYENTSRAGNATYVFKTKPTISNVALPTTVLTTGTVTIGQVMVTADAGGSLAWRRLVWNVATSSPSGSFVISAPVLYDAADQSTALTGITTTYTNNGGAAGAAGGVITASSTAGAAEQQISGSKTYVLKVTVTGAPVTGSAISTTLAASSTSRTAPSSDNAFGGTRFPTFAWSDMSALSHSETTSDWMDDYLVKNLPTDAQTVTK